MVLRISRGDMTADDAVAEIIARHDFWPGERSKQPHLRTHGNPTPCACKNASNSDSIGIMPNVLIRDVPADDLDQIRSAAAARGMSLQAYLLEAVHAQAAHLRRREALNQTAARLTHQRAVDEQDRQAVLEAIDEAHAERGAELGRAT